MPTVGVRGLQCVIGGTAYRGGRFGHAAVFREAAEQLALSDCGLIQAATAGGYVSVERIGNRAEQMTTEAEIGRGNLVPLQVLGQYVDAVVPDITDVDQIVVGNRVLSTGHPLLHIGRVADVINYWIQAETDVRQSAQRISRYRNLAVRERTLARRGRPPIAAVQGRVSTKSGEGVESAVKTCDPRCPLREADVGTLTVVVRHIKDAISGAHYQLVTKPVRRTDSWGKVLVLGIVESTVAAAVEHKLARIVCADRGADRIYGVEVEVLLRIRSFRWGGLDFVAQT